MKNLSILQNYRSALLQKDPFYHFDIEQALPTSLYESLANTYPTLETFYKYSHRNEEAQVKQNAFYKLNAAGLNWNPEILSGPWRDFVQFHTSQEFFDEVLDKLGDAIQETYPELLASMLRKAKGKKPRAGVRGVSDSKETCEVALDCMVGINSPVTVEGTRVIGAHLDNPKMLYAGLFYLRHPQDQSTGGDFIIYEWKDPKNPEYVYRRQIDEALVIPRRKVSYKANNFVWFLNNFSAVHGVATRETTPYPRRLCEIMADADPTVPKLFQLSGRPPKRSVMDWIGKVLGQ